MPAVSTEPPNREQLQLRVERRLRAQGEVNVRSADRVEPSTVVAVGAAVGRPVVISVARELGIEPNKVAERLSKRAGDAVEVSEAIARRRRGLRIHTAKSPLAGTLAGFNPRSGTATITPAAQRHDLAAYVVGVVEEVEHAWGVTIRTFGSRFDGVFGVGGEAFGVLNVVTKVRQHPLVPELIDSRTVREALRRRRLGGDLVLDALEVTLPNGEALLLPITNVEPLA